ncbi:Arabinose operon regulatory protein [Chryseobacterium gleum]|uniref:Arabinose operon regulatory protein n=2 Tax=Chryseobacterium gleum TaxID=250 RepID=A0A3S4N368_CHRGE|nr:helix-turn-helix domain-containing protein [Chryseobacterium gleum]EFK33519.1 transcriptional regulator, AraC family [Chryseobacterium gleum ATCC 35910]QQY34301.1 helix-turn-helix domain-containing protein [Chryseobacterium gleum]VEE06883.1 Arabinose operon regulatory protein [Chryseobacterium gleum]
MKKAIPSHHNQLENSAVLLMPLSIFHEKQAEIHRDDHYMFILQQKGDFVMEIDFNRIDLKGPSLCFAGPGQIHQYIHQRDNEGWFLFIEAELIPESYREILDLCQWLHQSSAVTENDIIFDLPPLFEKAEKDPALHLPSITRSLAESAVGIIISRISRTETENFQYRGQRYSITRQFKKLITEHFRTTKQVKQYADFLNITPLYLNEAVKDVTGYPASFWIQQKILWEARRLLYYTHIDVKQIAFELGFDDPVYFSRFFKKRTGMTALQFRAENHDLSHHHR